MKIFRHTINKKGINKKGISSESVLITLDFILLIVVTVIIIALVNHYADYQIKSEKIDADVFYYKVLNHPEGILFTDFELNKRYIDLNKISDPRFEENLIKITNFNADFIGAKFNVYYPSPKNDNSIEFYYNRDIYDTFILFSKASGVGTATLTQRELPVLVKEGNTFRNGMLKSEILVLNS